MLEPTLCHRSQNAVLSEVPLLRRGNQGWKMHGGGLGELWLGHRNSTLEKALQKLRKQNKFGEKYEVKMCVYRI